LRIVSENPDTETNGPKERGLSQIQYIDEENDETETDKLLPDSGTGSDISGQRASSSSAESAVSVERVPDETTPMVASGGVNGVSKNS